jgi:hypothetical protein
MPFQEPTNDPKRAGRDTGMRALSRDTKLKIGASVAALAVLAGGLALRGRRPSGNHRPQVATSDRGAAAAAAEVPRPPRAAKVSYATGKTEESQGEYKAAAQDYAAAARKGDARGLKKLVAMTRAPKCEARSEAADALGTFRSKKATAALKRLSRARFKDESRSPGIFSCSSHRAAQKALEKQRGRS